MYSKIVDPQFDFLRIFMIYPSSFKTLASYPAPSFNPLFKTDLIKDHETPLSLRETGPRYLVYDTFD
jgi:hypothetical protein